MKLVVILACVLCISVGKHFFTLLLIKGFFMGRKQLFIGKPMEGPLSSDQLHESHSFLRVRAYSFFDGKISFESIAALITTE